MGRRLLTAVSAAFVPLIWVIVVGLLLAALAASRWVWRVSLLNAAIVVITPFLVLFPWSLNLVTRPSTFLLEAGLTRDGLSSASLKPSSLLLLHPGGPGLPPLWVTAAWPSRSSRWRWPGAPASSRPAGWLPWRACPRRSR